MNNIGASGDKTSEDELSEDALLEENGTEVSDEIEDTLVELDEEDLYRMGV